MPQNSALFSVDDFVSGAPVIGVHLKFPAL
jgi:hypothetical protein